MTIVFIGLFITTLILLAGLFVMTLSPTLNEKYGNKLMTLRVIFQFFTIIILMLIYFINN